VDRVAARHGVVERQAGLAAGVPPPGPLPVNTQHAARPASGPAAGDRVVNQREQLGFHGP
jgi:hypothetical protein